MLSELHRIELDEARAAMRRFEGIIKNANDSLANALADICRLESKCSHQFSIPAFDYGEASYVRQCEHCGRKERAVNATITFPDGTAFSY